MPTRAGLSLLMWATTLLPVTDATFIRTTQLSGVIACLLVPKTSATGRDLPPCPRDRLSLNRSGIGGDSIS
jgi:hypothetical protein